MSSTSSTSLRDRYARELMRLFNDGMSYSAGEGTPTKEQIVGQALDRVASETYDALTTASSEFVLRITPQQEVVTQDVQPFVVEILKHVGIDPAPRGEAIRPNDV